MKESDVRIAVIGLTGDSVFMAVPRFHVGGETVHATGLHRELGGKGFNQAVAAARQGARVSFLTAVGSEDVERVRGFLAGEGIEGHVIGKAQPSAHAAILTDGTGETRVTVYPGARLDVADVDSFAEAVRGADFLVIGNEVPEEVNIAAAEIAAAGGTKVILNPAPSRALSPRLVRNVWLFTPNEFEESALGEVDGEVVVTLGARGCRIRSTGEVVPAPRATAVDSTGAGDTFNGVLAVRLACGDVLADACRAANAAAAKSVAVRYVLPSIPYFVRMP